MRVYLSKLAEWRLDGLLVYLEIKWGGSAQPDVDGGLIGRASLNVKIF